MEPKAKRVYTKTVCVLDPYGKTFCGQVAKLCNKPYCLIKTGRILSFEAVDDPRPRSYILELEKEGAYRIQDGQDSLSLIITQTSVEASTERWEEWKFETLSPIPMATLINVGGKRIDAEVKYCKGMGLVVPYTKNEMDRKEIPNLPGVLPSSMGVRELREKLRNERDQMKPKEVAVSASSQQNELQITESWDQLKSKVKAVSDWEVEQPSTSHVDDDVDADDDDEGDYLTNRYMKKVSLIVKNPDPSLLGMAFGYPKTSGPFDRIITEKECVWNGVPVYDVDLSNNSYRLVMIGEAKRYLLVVKGQNYFVLPAGENV
uniref:Non-structural protein NS2 n=1 Tax=Changuinola virus TaxID=40052 RepID=U5YII1_9REOV|nr:inclusion body NS2 [Changuinola virus]